VLFDYRSKKQRERDNINLETNFQNIAKEVRTIANLTYSPPIIGIDAYPIYEIESEEYLISIRNRSLLLNLIANAEPVSMSDIQFKKQKR